MYKLKFEESLNSHPLKTNISKAVRNKLLETLPKIEEHIEEIWPKNAKVLQLKLKGDTHLSFYQIDGEILFMELRDYPIVPMLRLLHKYPEIMTHVQCDKGAIKHIFSGSHVMAPGLTSQGGHLPDNLDEMHPVAVMAEGKQHAMAIGVMSMDSGAIRKVNKGQAIEIMQFMNDGLWSLKAV